MNPTISKALEDFREAALAVRDDDVSQKAKADQSTKRVLEMRKLKAEWDLAATALADALLEGVPNA